MHLNKSIIARMLIVWSLIYAYLNRFIQDDAYITFVYARNLASGRGLTWCTGEYVEGFSNFLWVLVAAVGELLNLKIEYYIYTIGLCLFAASMLIWLRLAKDYFSEHEWIYVLFLLGLSTNHSWTAFATGGLETPLVTFLLTAQFAMILNVQNCKWTVHRSLIYSFILILGILTRMDFALLAIPSLIYLISRLLRERRLRSIMALILPALLLLGGAILMRIFYYGTLVPNSYWIKCIGDHNTIRVTIYFGLFFGLTQLYLVFPAMFYLLRKYRDRITILLVVTILLWLIYLLWIGGDFMEFRMLVPIIPLFYLLILRGLSDLLVIHKKTAIIGFILLLGIAPAAHLLSDMRVFRPVVSTIRSLHTTIEGPYGWKSVGKSLKQILPEDCRIGVTAAGVIPYYSGLYCVDMLGLNNVHISRNGMLIKTTAAGINPNIKFGVRQGHGRMGRYGYALKQNINFLLMHPVVISDEGHQESVARILDETQTISTWREFLLDAYQSADTLTFVLIPVKDRFLITLYCHKSDVFDELISNQNFPRFDIQKDDWLRPFVSDD